MKIIIDTHIFLWSLADPTRIAKNRINELESQTNIIYVSSITIAELMIKASIGKLQINFDPIELAEQSVFELLDFSGRDALLLQNLPFHHRDPFVRIPDEKGHRSGGKAASIPIRKRPAFRSNPASIK